mmetsp:Transcript_2824/g.7823  ORF Transcript_2824/g.7823 Transcript_2824/m.7823 type:complete len:1452 (-) Transcript_2824:296-4651(-)|eukprot:CAMPEP_0198113390 /NCGR_PEP_ID=MMETSP1442-20131203/5065_1 /TAXON_ID= /ORGANISM="Craspedostauros australis, Strain CCMP3328" /LENGTH=1451 /DNA_ID=CAMNT_0043770459 /DNA_START=120 /DNA_END=4475 /DNA_ORIENTATION=+
MTEVKPGQEPVLYWEKEEARTYPRNMYVKMDVYEDPSDPANTDTVETQVLKFDDGSAEEWLRFRREFDTLMAAKRMTTATQKMVHLNNLLMGDAQNRFATAVQAVPGNTAAAAARKLKEGLAAVGVPFFGHPSSAWRRQRNYMRQYAKYDHGELSAFRARLLELNQYLPFMPSPGNGNVAASFPDFELVEILDRASPEEYCRALLQSGYQVYEHSFEDLYRRLLDVANSCRPAKKNHSAKKGKKAEKGLRGNRSNKGRNDRNNKRKNRDSGDAPPKCGRCSRIGHNTSECWNDPKNADSRPSGWRVPYKGKKSPGKNDESLNVVLTQEVFNQLVSSLPSKRTKKKKRRISDEDDENANYLRQLQQANSDNSSTSSDSTNYPMTTLVSDATCYSLASRKAKKRKQHHASTEVIGEAVNRAGNIAQLRILLDSGTSSCLVLREFAPRTLKNGDGVTKWKTMGGSFCTSSLAMMQFVLPEFHGRKSIRWTMHVDETTQAQQSQYDMIVGTDLMHELGIDLSFSMNSMTWDNVTIPMKNRGVLTNKEALDVAYHVAMQSTLLNQAEDRQKRIMDADYSEIALDTYVSQLNHLNRSQQQQLLATLQRTPQTFKGGLGTLKIKPVRLELKAGAKPFHGKAFPVPKAYEQVTKKESKRFESIGVWEKFSNSDWAAPSFIQPKKTGDVRVLTDFRELNKHLKRRPYPLPKIQDMLQKLEQFKYATAFDLSMGYYHIPLDVPSQNLCTTVLPWGKYRYKKLPMGISTAPDIFQRIMNELLGDLEFALVYLDDILVLSDTNDSDEDHLSKCHVVLVRLQEAGFAVNLRKSFFMMKELDYLGYHLTQRGLEPQPKKVEAIQRVLPPSNKRQLRRFLGMINYYRDMWKRRSHTLAPLTTLAAKNTKWHWGKAQQVAFCEAKQMVMREAALAYPDFSKEFHVHADASDYQLGGVIAQEGKPLAFYTRKLNAAQTRYTTGEKELLSIVETLKAFNNILLGQQVTIHTDHLNLLYKPLSSNRLQRWRILLEEYGPTVVHVKGENNVVADALSRLPMEHRDDDVSNTTEEERTPLSYMSTTETESAEFPMKPTTVQKYQQKDKILQQHMKTNSNTDYTTKNVEGVPLIHYKDKIFVPKGLRARITEWYHHYLVHPGQTRMEATIRQLFYWPGLKAEIADHCKSCKQCQLSKKNRKKYGHLPAKQAETNPWERVNVDLIGPYTITTPSKQKHEMRAMTMIDPATGWFEIAAINKPNSAETQRAFDSQWLARYPRPSQCGFDNGSEFKLLFSTMCDNFGIKKKTTTSHNPQGNAILERIHQVLGDAFRTFQLDKQEHSGTQPWEPFLTAVAYAVRTTYHTTLQATPGQLVFGRDMLLPVRFKVDWAHIAKRKQEAINRSNNRENSKRIAHKYKIGDKVLVTKPGLLPKMAQPREGPFTVKEVFTNGTLLVRKGIITERINIRRITPFFE